MPFDSSSTQGIYDAIRDRLLTFVPMGLGAVALGTLLRALPRERLTDPVKYAPVGEERLYTPSPPDDLVYPYGMVNLLPRFSDMGHQGEREATTVEVIFVHYGRGNYWELSKLADIADQAMLRWRVQDAAGGFLGCKEKMRQPIPQPPLNSPADRNVIQEMIRYPLIAWPRYLNQYRAA